MTFRCLRDLSSPVRILVTGFGPFPGVEHNASADLADGVRDAAPMPGIKVFAKVIPVIWAEAMTNAREAARAHEPHAILHFGVAKRTRGFEIERRASNLCGAKPDHAGEVRRAGPLVGGAPAIRQATLPPSALCSALMSAGYPARLSNNAGRYLCNALFYSSLTFAHGSALPLVGFVHIPAIGVETKVEPRLTMADLIDGARVLVRASAHAVLRERAKRGRR